MRTLLNSQMLSDDQSLLQALKQVVTQLRHYDVWRSRESLEDLNPETGEYQTRTDLPSTPIETEDPEASEMVQRLHQQLLEALNTSLKQALTARIAKLKQSKRYTPFADKVVIGLQYYYRDRISLREMPPLLGMSSNDQARRILDPGGLLNQVRSLTIQQLLAQVLAIVENKKLAPWPPSPDYLQQLSEQLEGFADDEIFQAAAADMKAGSHRKLDSAYAQAILHCLECFECSS